MRFPKALIAAFVVATFSLAACHPKRHEGPAETAGEKIDKGMTDRQIFEELLKLYGPELTRPHLLQ